jgi:hypothetical protein
MLIEGREQVPPTDPDSVETPPTKCAIILRSCWIDVLFADYSRAWDAAKIHIDDFDRALRGFYLTPIYATVSVIIMAERWPSVLGRERRRMRRWIRKCRKITEHWAANCQVNYGPMLQLIDAEIASISGNTGEALHGYERAHMLAAANRMLWLSGLASHRLAIQARRHGHTLVIEAALRAARNSYEAWGATALVLHLDSELAGLAG